MDIDLMTGASTWADSADLATKLQDAGFSGMLYTETTQVPWMQIAAAASAAPDLFFTTGIAVAFPRSPMVSAAVAWEIAENTGGRFRLGLGSQVKPRPHDHPMKVDISAVGPIMTRVAGEVADGIHVHPLHSMPYIQNRLLPDVAKGAAKAGRDTSEIDLIIPVFACPGDTPEERAPYVEVAKRQIAFYGSTPNYAFQFDDLGFEGTTSKIREKMKAGELDAAPAASATPPAWRSPRPADESPSPTSTQPVRSPPPKQSAKPAALPSPSQWTSPAPNRSPMVASKPSTVWARSTCSSTSPAGMSSRGSSTPTRTFGIASSTSTSRG